MGGPTVKVRALALGLASSGHDVTVLTADLGLIGAKQEIVGAVPGRWGFESRENGVESIYLRTRARYRALTWNPGVAASAASGSAAMTSLISMDFMTWSDLVSPARAGGVTAHMLWNQWACSCLLYLVSG